jgi:S1-C subfamily serine protease
MEIRCRCSACQAKFKVDVKYAGKKARCPKCQQVVDVPLESMEGSTVTSLPALGVTLPAAPGPGISNSPGVPPKSGVPNPAQSATFPKPAVSAPAAAALPTSGAPAGFPNLNLNAPKPGPGATGSQSAANQTGAYAGRKKSNPLPLIIGGGIAAALLVGIGIVAVIALSRAGGGGAAPGETEVASGSPTDATLVIDLAADERRGAGLSINGRKEPIPASGEIKFTLPPGQHRVLLQRRGFEPVEQSVRLAKGQSERIKPQWKPSAVAAVQPPIGPATSVASNTPGSGIPGVNLPPGADFQFVPAVTSVAPEGFEGWLQNLEFAGTRAAEEKKDVLVVFGCSDDSPATQELAEVLQLSDLKAAIQSRFVPVVIDFPRTNEGFNLIENSAQNNFLRRQYAIREVPVLVLLDEKTRPYFIERKWEDGFDGVLGLINANQSQRAERDRLLTAAEQGAGQERLVAAEQAIEWLGEHKLVTHYPQERQAWLTLARQADAENTAGRLEKFLEPDWLVRIVEAAQSDNKPAVLAAVQELDPWFTRKFVSQDRGARMHMIAARILLAEEESDLAMRQMERAISYQPADKELREALSALRLALQNKDVLGSGTGFLISSAGYVLTNHHVIAGEGRIEIRVPGTKETVPAELVAHDAERDMALLKVAMPDADKYRPIALLPDPIRRGAAVAAFGYPLGDELGTGLKFTNGSVSALPDESNEQMYMLDLTVNPGNSGGPLCDRRGNVVGMVTKKSATIGFEDSYGFAVPATDLLKFLDQHLPASAPRIDAAAEGAALDWDQVDEKVSSGVLMILKKK